MVNASLSFSRSLSRSLSFSFSLSFFSAGCCWGPGVEPEAEGSAAGASAGGSGAGDSVAMALSSSARTNLATDTSLRRASLLREGMAVAVTIKVLWPSGKVLVVPWDRGTVVVRNRTAGVPDDQWPNNATLVTGLR